LFLVGRSWDVAVRGMHACIRTMMSERYVIEYIQAVLLNDGQSIRAGGMMMPDDYIETLHL
jgi:hypothetical protein